SIYILCLNLFLLFFFSSRRRHTRSKRDWSSDVCSSDLGVVDVGERPAFGILVAHLEDAVRPDLADGDGVLHRARDFELDALLTFGGCQRLAQWRASGVVLVSGFCLVFGLDFVMRFLRFALGLLDLKSSVFSLWFLGRCLYLQC